MADGKSITLKEVGETLAFIVERMATKDDLRNFATKDDVRAIVGHIVDEKLKPISDELASIRRDLNDLMQRAENSAGLTKEIDHALERIGAIEKHLGLNKKIAA
jgi:DNA-binding transcriptional regulator GbsR (MarR family)